MTDENRALFLDHALKQMPKEACALLISKGKHEELVLCPNASQKNDQFIINPKCYAFAELEGDIIAVIHSHVYIPARASEADRVACEASGVPWHILSVPTGKWGSISPSGYKAPLIGREFSHGILDCYSLVRDYFKEMLSIEIPDFERDFEWWDKGDDLYKDHFKEAGFFEVPLKQAQVHDVILMQIYSNVMNHAGIYLGNNTMLHHLNGRLSCREVYGGYYKKHTQKIVRHKCV